MNKNYLILSLVVVLVAGAFLAGQFTSMVSTSGTVASEGVKHGGATCFQIIRAGGMVEDLGCKHNQFQDEGKAYLADEIGTDNSTNCVDYMWLGSNNFTGAANAANFDSGVTGVVYNASGSSNLDPASCTGFYIGAWQDWGVGTGNISASCLWTAGESVTVWSTALNCSNCGASTEFFAVNNFTTAATLAANDQLNVTWYVWST